MEHNIDKMLQCAFKQMRAENPRRQLVTHERSRHRISLTIAVTGIAAMFIAGLFVFSPQAPKDDFVCYVNGARIVDRDTAIEQTRQALDVVNTRLERSAQDISQKMEHVNQILNKTLL